MIKIWLWSTFPSDLPDRPAPLKPLIAKVSSRTVSYISSGHQQQQNALQPPQTFPKPPLNIQPQSFSEPPPTYPKPFTHSLQTQPKAPGPIQSLSKPYPQVALQNQQTKLQVPPQTPPKPHSFPQALASQSQDHLEDFGRNSVYSGDLLSPTEPGDLLSDGMSAKQMSIRER